MFEFKLADLGEGIHEGEILKWYVKVGDTIVEDAPLVDLETDKAAVTIPSPRAGKITFLAGKEGETVFVGKVLATIDDGNASAVPTPVKEAVPAAASPAPKAAVVAAFVPVISSGPVVAAPATRKLARDLGIDIRMVAGSGSAGRISADDVKAFHSGGGRSAAASAASGPPRSTSYTPGAPSVTGSASAIPFYEPEALPNFGKFGPVEVEPFRSIRRKIAKKMVTSMVLIPHVGHQDEADVTALEAMRKQWSQMRPNDPDVKITLMPFIIRACVLGLKEFPKFNSSLDPYKEELIYKRYYNIGIAADTPKGLIVPVIKEVEKKGLPQIAIDLKILSEKARTDKLEVADLQGGNFTITNVGGLGGCGMIPVINYPEVAILGVGQMKEKPVVRDGQIVIRKMLPLVIGFDHRVIDGADAARFMSKLVKRLSNPAFLFVES